MTNLKPRNLAIKVIGALVGVAAMWFLISTHTEAPDDGELSIPAEVPLPKIEPADLAPRLTAVQRYLRASEYIETLRLSVRNMVATLEQQQTPTNAPMDPDPLAGIDARAAEAAVAPLVARHLTLAQANEIADFYESPAGKFLVRRTQQGALTPPESELNGPHQAAIDRFLSSDAGRTLIAINSEPDVTQAVLSVAGKRGTQ